MKMKEKGPFAEEGEAEEEKEEGYTKTERLILPLLTDGIFFHFCAKWLREKSRRPSRNVGVICITKKH